MVRHPQVDPTRKLRLRCLPEFVGSELYFVCSLKRVFVVVLIMEALSCNYKKIFGKS